MPGSVMTEDHVERETADPAESTLLSLEVGVPLERPTGDHIGARAIVAESQAFAALLHILVKRIVNLQEMLEFYELNWRSDLHDNELADLAQNLSP